MSGTDILDTETPAPPARHHWKERLGPLRRLSERTSLRTKLITALLALVIMALAAISVASVYMLRGYVTTQRDNQLASDFFQAANSRTLSTLTAGEAGNTSSQMVLGIQLPGHQLSWAPVPDNPYMGSGAGPSGPLPSLPTSANWATGSSPVTITAPSQSGPDTWRVMAAALGNFPVSTSSGAIQYETVNVVLAVDLGNINAETARLILFDLIVGGAIVVVLAAVGTAVVQANLRPLNDIELTAGQIAEGHLEHRVPEGDPRTEIGSLGRSLNAMLAQIERAFRAQGEAEQAAHQSEERMRRFIADAAHELRTPLTTIRGFAAHYRQRGGVGDWSSRAPADGSGLSPGSGLSSGTGAACSPTPRSAASGAADSEADSSGTVASETAGSWTAGSWAPGSWTPASWTPGESGAMSREELDRLMSRVESEATRMGLLVEDLLTLARLDQQRPLSKGPVDLLSLAADAVQDARIVSPGRPISLSVAPGTAFIVDGDEPRLRQVLANLVNNAITHTPTGTAVRVKIARGVLEASAAADRREPVPPVVPAPVVPAPVVPVPVVPAVVLDVEDDGPGMAPEQAQRVFERFFRADAARNRASGGTGLGLSIVAGLVSAHGGTVAVRTAPGRGADFQVKLPLSPDVLGVDDVDEDED